MIDIQTLSTQELENLNFEVSKALNDRQRQAESGKNNRRDKMAKDPDFQRLYELLQNFYEGEDVVVPLNLEVKFEGNIYGYFCGREFHCDFGYSELCLYDNDGKAVMVLESDGLGEIPAVDEVFAKTRIKMLEKTREVEFSTTVKRLGEKYGLDEKEIIFALR